MAFIDNLQKISDTVWELPATYKEGMRVLARIIATEKLLREMDEAVYQQNRQRWRAHAEPVRGRGRATQAGRSVC